MSGPMFGPMSGGDPIRPVAPTDLPALVDLCRRHADYENLPFREDGQVERWRDAFFGDAPRLYGWVVEEPGSGRLIGYMTAVLDYATWAARPFVYMDCLYLSDEVRGRGLGRRLIERLRVFMREQGCLTAEWHTPPENEIGIGFYRRIGAAERPKLRFFLDADDSGASSA